MARCERALLLIYGSASALREVGLPPESQARRLVRDEDVVVFCVEMTAPEVNAWSAGRFDELMYRMDDVIRDMRTEHVWVERLLADPQRDRTLDHVRGDWAPLCVVDSVEDLGVAPCRSGPVSFYSEWDGVAMAISASDDTNAEERLVEIAASHAARWTYLRAAVIAARNRLLDDADSPAQDLTVRKPTPQDRARLDRLFSRSRAKSIGPLDEAREASRLSLARAFVVFDSRPALYYGYESLFYEHLDASWNMRLMEDAARTALTSLAEVISVRSRAISGAAARRTALWLFVISVASGLSAVLSGLEFVASRDSLGIGTAARLVVLIALSAATLALGLTYRSANSAISSYLSSDTD